MCKRQNQSGTKTFRIHHESGTISSSVKLVSANFFMLVILIFGQVCGQPVPTDTLYLDYSLFDHAVFAMKTVFVDCTI